MVVHCADGPFTLAARSGRKLCLPSVATSLIKVFHKLYADKDACVGSGAVALVGVRASGWSKARGMWRDALTKTLY